MKETYESIVFDIVEFDAEDVISTSDASNTPTSDHYDDYEGQGYIFG